MWVGGGCGGGGGWGGGRYLNIHGDGYYHTRKGGTLNRQVVRYSHTGEVAP